MDNNNYVKDDIDSYNSKLDVLKQIRQGLIGSVDVNDMVSKQNDEFVLDNVSLDSVSDSGYINECGEIIRTGRKKQYICYKEISSLLTTNLFCL